MTQKLTGDSSRLQAVRAFADLALTLGKDRLRGTPLLADGVNVATRQPVVWHDEGSNWVVCDPACQQNLYRMLTSLSEFDQDTKYRDAASAAMRYFFEHYADRNGLLHWGGHQFVDLATGNVVGEQSYHEFKCAYPYYEFLFEVEPASTARFIKSLWNAHVLNWSNLDLTRHGSYDKPMGRLWDEKYVGGPVFFEGAGLSFINAGSDLIYAAGLLYLRTGDAGALQWAKCLAHRYVEARNPDTQLGAYQYSQTAATAGRGQAGTLSSGGDRARNQFGPEFGELALEGKILTPSNAEIIYGKAAISQMQIAEQLGPAGADLLESTRVGMVAYAKYAYDVEKNLLLGMFTDGTRILPSDIRRRGYYSPATFEPRAPGPLLFFSYALAWRLTSDPVFWQTLRNFARGFGLGEFGSADGSDVRLRAATSDDPILLFTFLELAKSVEDPRPFLEFASTVGDNILLNRFRSGLFLRTSKHANASFSALEPLALLALEAAVHDRPAVVPRFVASSPYIQGPHYGMGRTTDGRVFWGKLT